MTHIECPKHDCGENHGGTCFAKMVEMRQTIADTTFGKRFSWVSCANSVNRKEGKS